MCVLYGGGSHSAKNSSPKQPALGRGAQGALAEGAWGKDKEKWPGPPRAEPQNVDEPTRFHEACREDDQGEQITKHCSEGFQKQEAPIAGVFLLLKDGLE